MVELHKTETVAHDAETAVRRTAVPTGWQYLVVQRKGVVGIPRVLASDFVPDPDAEHVRKLNAEREARARVVAVTSKSQWQAAGWQKAEQKDAEIRERVEASLSRGDLVVPMQTRDWAALKCEAERVMGEYREAGWTVGWHSHRPDRAGATVRTYIEFS